MAEKVLSWVEHADGLEGEQLALALMRAHLSPDEDELEVVLGRVRELIAECGGDPDRADGLGALDSALVSIAVRFGVLAFGDLEGVGAALAQMQRDVAEHVANYEPETGGDGVR